MLRGLESELDFVGSQISSTTYHRGDHGQTAQSVCASGSSPTRGDINSVGLTAGSEGLHASHIKD